MYADTSVTYKLTVFVKRRLRNDQNSFLTNSMWFFCILLMAQLRTLTTL